MPRRPDPERPSVLVLKEKHERRYVSALNAQELHRAALAIVLQRQEEGWYPKEPSAAPRPPVLTEEQSRALPAGPIRTAALQEWHDYRNALQNWEYIREDVEALAEVLKTRDGLKAWHFLDQRRDHEYEGFELHALEVFPTEPTPPSPTPETPT